MTVIELIIRLAKFNLEAEVCFLDIYNDSSSIHPNGHEITGMEFDRDVVTLTNENND